MKRILNTYCFTFHKSSITSAIVVSAGLTYSINYIIGKHATKYTSGKEIPTKKYFYQFIIVDQLICESISNT